MGDAEPFVLGEWNAHLREQIEAEVRKAVKKPVDISSEQWTALHSILASYTKAHNDWLGYLDRKEAAALEDVAKNAKRLGEALEKVRGMELSWIIDDTLKNGSTEQLAEELAKLAKVDNRSPRIRERNEEGQIVSPTIPPPSRAALHGEMKAWWLGLAGLRSAKIKDTILREKRTPFSRFLEVAYSILREEISPGWSATTVKEYGRELRRSERQMREIAEIQSKLKRPS